MTAPAIVRVVSSLVKRLPPTARRTLRRAKQRGRRAAGKVRRQLDASRAARLRDPGDPRLLFRPANSTWYVELDEKWYEPAAAKDLDALLTLLPAEIIDDQILASVGSVGGLVRVVGDDDSPTLEFLTSFGEIVRRVAQRIPGVLDAVAEWEHGHHADGWVESSASIRLDGVRRCTLVAFLPAGDNSPDSHGKELAVQVTGGRHTDVDIHRLARGAQTRVEIYRSRSAAHGLVVTLQASEPEQVDDDRSLGFVGVALEAYA